MARRTEDGVDGRAPRQAARAVVISNPIASGVTPAVEARVLRELRGLVAAELVRTERPLHARDLAVRAIDDGADAVVVLAGDGTTNEVLNGVGARAPIGALPAGGTSVLARSLGLPRDVPLAARRVGEALAAGRERRISLGVLNGRRFGFAAGIGLDAEAVRRVDARGRARGRRPGDVVFALEVARLSARARYARPVATLVVDGRSERVASVLAANVHPWTYLGPRPLLLAPRALPEAGLEVVAPRHLRRRDVPRLARHLLLTGAHAHDGDPAILYRHDVDAADVTCDRPLAAQDDGDDVGDVVTVRLGVDREGARLLV